jgi:putative hemolysin
MHIAIISILIAFNGLFALAEIAIVSCKKSRLRHAAELGNARAKTVLALLEDPERFLSAIQVGITLIGIVSGAYSGVALAEDLRPCIARIEALAPYAHQISMVLLVVVITFCSIVFGELIPKTIALSNPEPIAFFLVPFIAAFTRAAYPVIILLSATTRLMLRAFRLRQEAEPPLSEEELRVMIKTAGRQGVLQQEEMQLHENLFLLSDKRAFHIMTNRAEVDILDIARPCGEIEQTIRGSMHSCFPVYEQSLDNIIGVLRAKDFFAGHCDPKFDPRTILIRPVFLPERLTPLQIVKIFREAKMYFGIVVNEYGAFEGVLTLHDLIEHVLGDMPDAGEDQHHIVTMTDGALLVDGSTPLFDIMDALHLDMPGGQHEKYATIAGFVFDRLKNIPVEGASLPLGDFLLEIVDMDGPRIDKIMIRKKPQPVLM